MEIQNTHSAAEISGIQASAFGFEMNAKMYDILISKMYTNKPGAVIRELSANAWDSHVEAGKTDVPFHLHLPSWLDKTFRIRDFGVGIPHESFEKIYTNVGKSTKEGTNELIGGFGLGSKAPFTMTDSFVVENWRDGRKTTWICFKDKGVPQVSKVADEPSDEETGLQVSFSFDSNEVNEFTRQVQVQLRYFPVKPVITGGVGNIVFPELPEGWETKDYFFHTKGSDSDGISYVVMGNVSYVLNRSVFAYNYMPIFNAGVVLKVPIGAVDIPPSRENIEFTPRTLAYLTDRLDVILMEYADTLKKEFEKCTTVFELRKVAQRANRHMVPNAFLSETYLGVTVSSLMYPRINSIAGYELFGIVSNKYKPTSQSVPGIVEGTVKFFINDLGPGHKAYIMDKADVIIKQGVDSRNVSILQPPKCKPKELPTVLNTMQDMLKAETKMDIPLLSSVIGHVPKKPKDTSGSVKAEPNQVFKVTKHDLSETPSHPLAFAEEVIGNLPTDGYYLEISGFKVVTKVTDDLLKQLNAGLHLHLNKPLYLVRSKTVPKLKGLSPLTKEIVDKVLEEALSGAEEAAKVEAMVKRYCILPSYGELLKDVPRFRAVIRLSEYLKKKKEAYRTISETACRLAPKSYREMLQKFGNQPESHRTKETLELCWDMREFLNQVCNSYSTERHAKRLRCLELLINKGEQTL